LIGLFPGYALASYDSTLQTQAQGPTYSKNEILQAASISLLHRGNGTGPDGDAGWEKAWRAAAWAQLGDTESFYHQLTYTLYQNFGQNLLSLYDPFSAQPVFQIDANLAYPATVMNALIQIPDVPTLDTPLVITLLPALPSQWSSGYIRGARIRGGITLHLVWSNGKPTDAEFRVDEAVIFQRQVRVMYNGEQIGSFVTNGGYIQAYSSF
jgi:alpha-L-fucosidase 2